jgi:hypothetical protein
MSHVDNTTPKHPFISNKFYDVIKFIATIVLPASGAAYFGLAGIWGLPFGEEIVGTITIVDTFLGAVLIITTVRYNKSDARFDGALVVDTSDPVKDSYLIEVDNLATLPEKTEVSLKVTSPTL